MTEGVIEATNLEGKVDALLLLFLAYAEGNWTPQQRKAFVQEMEAKLADTDMRDTIERMFGADYATGYEFVIWQVVQRLGREVGEG